MKETKQEKLFYIFKDSLNNCNDLQDLQPLIMGVLLTGKYSEKDIKKLIAELCIELDEVKTTLYYTAQTYFLYNLLINHLDNVTDQLNSILINVEEAEK